MAHDSDLLNLGIALAYMREIPTLTLTKSEKELFP